MPQHLLSQELREKLTKKRKRKRDARNNGDLIETVCICTLCPTLICYFFFSF